MFDSAQRSLPRYFSFLILYYCSKVRLWWRCWNPYNAPWIFFFFFLPWILNFSFVPSMRQETKALRGWPFNAEVRCQGIVPWLDNVFLALSWQYQAVESIICTCSSQSQKKAQVSEPRWHSLPVQDSRTGAEQPMKTLKKLAREIKKKKKKKAAESKSGQPICSPSSFHKGLGTLIRLQWPSQWDIDFSALSQCRLLIDWCRCSCQPSPCQWSLCFECLRCPCPLLPFSAQTDLSFSKKMRGMMKSSYKKN